MSLPDRYEFRLDIPGFAELAGLARMFLERVIAFADFASPEADEILEGASTCLRLVEAQVESTERADVPIELRAIVDPSTLQIVIIERGVPLDDDDTKASMHGRYATALEVFDESCWTQQGVDGSELHLYRKRPHARIDTLTSVLAAMGALAALRTRAETGKGERVDVSLIDALVHAQASGIGSYLITGEETPRTGNRSLYFAPSGVYNTLDGEKVVITCPAEKFFAKLCEALEVDWVSDPRFHDIDARMENQDELDRTIDARCREFTREELMERLIAADVLTAPLNSVKQVVNDPQIAHNNMLVTTDHPTLGDVKVTGVPLHFQNTPGRVQLPPPLQGQHTAELLAELGYGEESISQLVEDGAIGTLSD